MSLRKITEFISYEEADLLTGHYERVSHFAGPVRIEYKFYYPTYTMTLLVGCQSCINSFCLNCSCMSIIDYIFRDDVASSFRDKFL